MIVAAFALSVLVVPILVIALAVKATSKGPVFFGQIRIGQGGRPFRMLKFRTMRRDAGGSALTVPGDTRVTRLGRVLRASCLDELPQLLNILVGHMTLVGPRPQTPGFAARYPAELREIFQYRPGLTGPGVLQFNDEDVLPPGDHTSRDIEDFYLRLVVPNRVRVDLEFCAGATIARTLQVLWHTAALAPHRFARRKPVTQPVITLAEAQALPATASDGMALATESAQRRSHWSTR